MRINRRKNKIFVFFFNFKPALILYKEVKKGGTEWKRPKKTYRKRLLN